MGWSSGTDIVTAVAEAVKKNVPDDKARAKVYRALVVAAQSADWDCECEAKGIDPILDAILEERPYAHP